MGKVEKGALMVELRIPYKENMQGVDERAVLRLILHKQGGKIWIGMGLEGVRF
jgi:hypothetical protein